MFTSAGPLGFGKRAFDLTRAFVFIIATCLWPALVTAGTASEPLAAGTLSQSIEVSLTGDDGEISIKTRIEAPQGAIRLPEEDWLRLTAMKLDEEPVDLPDSGILPADGHKGQTMEFTFEGRLPKLDRAPRAVAHSPEGSYLIGSDWLPTDSRALHVFGIFLDVPASQTAVATGSRVSAKIDGGRYRATFTFAGRAEGIGIFTGAYDLRETRRDGRDLRTYFGTADASLSDAYLDAAAGYIRDFDTRIGQYPYSSFSIVSAPIPVGLGFAGLTYVSQSILAHPYMRGRSLAHEVLHSWWGNAVAVDYASGNWAEGLTTYQADHALAKASGDDSARKMRLDWLRALADLPPDADQPLTTFRSSSHDGQQAVGYGKAALVFHMLRDDIGAPAFDAGIRRFYAKQKHQVAGWSDLQHAFELAAGRDLDWFFDQWLTRSGLPELSLAEVTVQGNNTLRLTLTQTEPYYRLRVPVRIDTQGSPHMHLIDLQAASITRDITVPADATRISVDPDFSLARRLLQGETAPILADGLFDRKVHLLDLDLPEGFDKAATRLAGRIPGMSEANRITSPDNVASGAIVVIGDTDTVAAQRDRLIGSTSPKETRAGTARGWAERSPSGQVFVFISGDTPEDLAGNLDKLAYFGQLSFVAFKDGQQISAGNWNVDDSPLVRDLR